LIQQLLTTPRQAPSGLGLSGGGTGLAGVASTAKGQGIHIINDRKKYQEWEFIYDLKNDKTTGVGQAIQQQQQMLGAQGAGATGGIGVGTTLGGTTQGGTIQSGTTQGGGATTPPPNQ